MQLPKELTTVTPLSKAVALLMFISLPIIAFFFGMRYQMMIAKQTSVGPTPIPIACTMDAKICPDGSSVGRVGPLCEFAECPVSLTNGTTFTGVITSISYMCHMDGVCTIGVGKELVIVEVGLGPPGESRIKGSIPEGLLDENQKADFIGKHVEVYAKKSGGKTDAYTIFGDTSYYVKLLDEESQTGGMCGGIRGIECPDGYRCVYTSKYPDASGTCVKIGTRTPKITYTCPEGGYVNCMPIVDKSRNDCSTAYISWAKKNCPEFKVVY